MGQCASPGDLDCDVVQFREREHVGQVSEWLRRRGRHKGLCQAHMVNNYLSVWIAARQFSHERQIVRTHHVHRDTSFGAAGQDLI